MPLSKRLSEQIVCGAQQMVFNDSEGLGRRHGSNTCGPMKTHCAGFSWRSAAVDTRVRRQPTLSSGDRETDFLLRCAVVRSPVSGHLKMVAGQAITVCSDKPLTTKLRRFLISKIRKELRNRRFARHPQKKPRAGCGNVQLAPICDDERHQDDFGPTPRSASI